MTRPVTLFAVKAMAAAALVLAGVATSSTARAEAKHAGHHPVAASIHSTHEGGDRRYWDGDGRRLHFAYRTDAPIVMLQPAPRSVFVAQPPLAYRPFTHSGYFVSHDRHHHDLGHGVRGLGPVVYPVTGYGYYASSYKPCAWTYHVWKETGLSKWRMRYEVCKVNVTN